ncbi:DUF1684 domain-containing protein [Demequina maris]|uniref:DUF1684 domain-containing protein n=1 Tax=Demequina maris TaxID=1638982 RepID=UPI00078128E5|nr:DUF1684 domain-containing protein [Demequina maris]
MSTPSSYDAWLVARDHSAFRRHGLASLAATVWLSSEAVAVPGVPGSWCAEDGTVVGEHDRTAVQLAPGEEVELERAADAHPLVLRAFAREGAVALRVFDPDRAGAEGLGAIERYPHGAQFSIRGTFAAMRTDPTTVVSVDGHVATTIYDGVVLFHLDGERVEMLVHVDGDELFAAFADGSCADEEYDFRMLRLPAPGSDGRVTVDLNRAYLPPSRFSPHFVCVTPPPTNRWAVPVRAGERRIVPRDA